LAALLLVSAPVAAVELVFLASNLAKIGDGGYVPVLAARRSRLSDHGQLVARGTQAGAGAGAEAGHHGADPALSG
jgi:hypothetical protein